MTSGLLVQFGAGNIGRSFIGQLFARGGYEVAFVDIDPRLITALNERRRYDVIIKHPDGRDETLEVSNVSGIDGRDTAAVARVVADASILATSVGSRALESVLPVIANGLQARLQSYGHKPLDIIIAENLHSASDFFRERLRKLLPADYPLEEMVGLVETSIGKMVPIMRAEDVAKDPLWVFAEPYNRLIVDKRGFRNPVPAVEGLAAMDNIKAYVDRKLFIHNLGHSAAAYMGYLANPNQEYLWEALESELIARFVKECMMESAHALLLEYPEEFTLEKLEAHVDDLVARFRNRALGDTIHRVGRDVPRKLGKTDRLIGAMLLCEKHGLLHGHVAQAVAAGLRFQKGDESSRLFPADEDFSQTIDNEGVESALLKVSGLNPAVHSEKVVLDEILKIMHDAHP